jgi:hypothetical protein
MKNAGEQIEGWLLQVGDKWQSNIEVLCSFAPAEGGAQSDVNGDNANIFIDGLVSLPATMSSLCLLVTHVGMLSPSFQPLRRPVPSLFVTS